MSLDLSRRDWLAGCLTLFGGSQRVVAHETTQAALGANRGRIETVTGSVAAQRLGVILMHEHVLVDFIGAAGVSPSRYDADEVFKVVLPHVREAGRLGCETLVECTPAYLGRDVRLLKRLSEASGLHILTNTGYYGAANDKHLPAHAFEETAEQLSARWTREAQRGIEDTGIKPAFMKIGVDGAPLSAIDTKLVRAAALTHRETGLLVASHTTTGAAAIEELDLLEREKVPPTAFIWVHAHAERDGSFHERAARRGAWVEFDGLSEASLARHVELAVHMKREGLLDRVLVSHDAGWYHIGEPGGGQFRRFDTLFKRLVPALKARGFTDADLRGILVDNPRRALAGA